MKKMIMVATMLVAIFTIVGCTTFKAEGLSYAIPNTNDVIISSFERTVTVHEFVGVSGGTNLFNITADAMNEKISEVILAEIAKAGGNAAKNITIEYKVGVLHYLANAFTGTIWAPSGLTISGDIIRSRSSTASAELESEIDAAIAAL